MPSKRKRLLVAVSVIVLSGTSYALYQDHQAERRLPPPPLSLPSASSPTSDAPSIPPSVLGETDAQDAAANGTSDAIRTTVPSTESPLLRLRWQENAREQLSNGDFVIKPDGGVMALARRAVTAGILGRHIIEAEHIDSNSITSRTIRNKTIMGKDLADALSLGDVMVREGLSVAGDATIAGDLDVAGLITGTFAGAFAPSGDVDMTGHILTNIGDTGTDFTSTGGLTLADALAVSGGGASITGTLSLPSLTPTRLLATNGAGAVIVASVADWLAGGINQITVTNDGDGTATLALPQNIHTGATPNFAGLTLTGLSTAGIVTNTSGGVLGTMATLGAAYITPDSLDFTEFNDALTLDAPTDISVTGTNVFSITNTGTGNSFVVNDAASDTTPFVIDAGGNVGIGTSAPAQALDVNGNIRTTGSVEITGATYPKTLVTDNLANANIFLSGDYPYTDPTNIVLGKTSDRHAVMGQYSISSGGFHGFITSPNDTYSSFFGFTYDWMNPFSSSGSSGGLWARDGIVSMLSYGDKVMELEGSASRFFSHSNFPTGAPSITTVRRRGTSTSPLPPVAGDLMGVFGFSYLNWETSAGMQS